MFRDRSPKKVNVRHRRDRLKYSLW